MICKNCNHKNITKANFCANCSNPFTEEEREQAYKKTIYGKISILEELKEYVTLEKITTHPAFRIAVLVIIIVVGILFGRPHGNKMAILESKDYSVSQNTENKDFYLLTEKSEIGVGLYLPKKAEEITLEKTDGTTAEPKVTISQDDEIVLKADEESYYIISADYGSSKETIKVYVLSEE